MPLVALLALTNLAWADATSWLAAVRDTAYARALAPTEENAVQAAVLELDRARGRTLPAVRASERVHLAWDGTAGLALDASLHVPLLVPEADAAVRLAEARLRLDVRASAAARRDEVHALLAQAVAVLAADARVAALADLDHALDDRAARATQPDATSTPPAPRADDVADDSADGAAFRLELDARLLADRLDAQRREADRLRRDLAAVLAIAVPAPGPVRVPGAGATASLRGSGGLALPAPYGSSVASFALERCLAAADTVALERLAAQERRLAEEARHAQAATRIELELGAGVDLAGDLPAATRGRARLAVSVSLPPWAPTTGSAALRAGDHGLEQELTIAWPNLEPAALPADPDAATGHTAVPAPDPVAAAEGALLERLTQLAAREQDLRRRRRALLTGALAATQRAAERSSGGASGRSAALAAPVTAVGTLAEAYLRATVRLQLADVDQALALTRLDAARACGALPP